MQNIFGRDRARKTATVAAGALVFFCASAPAWADGTAIVNGWIEQSTATDILNLSAAKVSDSGSGGITRVEDLKISVSFDALVSSLSAAMGDKPKADAVKSLGYEMTFPTVEFTNLQDIGERYSVDKIIAPSMSVIVDIDVEGADMAPSNSAYEGISVEAMNWAKLPAFKEDKSKPLTQFIPILRAGLDFGFDEMSIQKVTSSSPVEPAGGEMISEYGPIVMGKTVRGDISSLDGGKFKMEFSLPKTDGDDIKLQNVSFTADSITAKDYNYGTMIDTFFATGAAASNDYRTGVGQMRMSGMKIDAPEENVAVTIGEIVMDDIGVRTPEGDIFAQLDTLYLAELAGNKNSMSEEEIISLVFRIYGAFSMGKFEISDVAATGPEIKTASLGAYGMSDFSSEGLGSFYMRDAVLEGLKGEVVKYGEMSYSGIKFPDMAALINFEKNAAAENIDEILKAIPIVGSIVNSGIEFKLPEQGVDFSLAKSEIIMDGHIGPVPTEIDIDVDNFYLPVAEMEEEPRKMFEDLGYETIDGSYDMNLNWDEATQDFNITLDTELVDGGRLTGNAALGSVPRIVFEKPDETAMFSLFATTFKNLNLKFDDDSIVERGLKVAAAKNRTDEATMKAQVMALLPVFMASLNDAELTAKVTQAVGNLVNDGSGLQVSVAAATPLPVVAIVTAMQSNPAQALQSLDIDVGN